MPQAAAGTSGARWHLLESPGWDLGCGGRPARTTCGGPPATSPVAAPPPPPPPPPAPVGAHAAVAAGLAPAAPAATARPAAAAVNPPVDPAKQVAAPAAVAARPLTAAPASATTQAAAAPAAAAAAGAELSMVPISVGRLQTGDQVEACARAVSELMRHLQLRERQLEGQQLQQQQRQQEREQPGEGSSGGGGQWQLVLIATSDFTHAGPGYGELPPPGIGLEQYMERQDSPVLQAISSGDADALLAAADRVGSSMCGLWPLMVALRVAQHQAWGRPRLLAYAPAHLLFPRPNSTGFAAFAVCNP